MTVGAGYTGVRAMTAIRAAVLPNGRSLGLAAITETPIVVIEGTRPGPPSDCRHARAGDLDFILHARTANFRGWCSPRHHRRLLQSDDSGFQHRGKIPAAGFADNDHYMANSYFTTINST